MGTTYLCASVMIDNIIIIIPNSLGLRTTISYVTFLSKDKVYVGDLDKLFPSYEKKIIYKVKRLIGRNYKDKEIEEIRTNKLFLFDLIDDNEFKSLKIKVGLPKEIKRLNLLDDNINRQEYYFYPEQITAII